MRRFILARYPDGNIVIVGPAGWAPRAREKVYLRAVDTGTGIDLEVRREQSADAIPYTWPGKSPDRAGELARAHYWRRAGTWLWQVLAARRLDRLLSRD